MTELKTSVTIPVRLAQLVDAVQVDGHPAFEGKHSWNQPRSWKLSCLLEYACAPKSTPKRSTKKR